MNVFPSFSLPPEITQQIFGACLPDAGSRPTKRSQQAPLLLTQICKEWRAIALDTPQLWQSITVNDSTRPVSPSMVKLWMSRANNGPRDISFITEDVERGAQFLKEIMVYSQEWRHVELRLPIDSFLDLAAYSGPFPLLRSLSLSIYTRHMFDHEQTITIRGAPLLRKVTLTDFPFLTSDISWEQLTILKVTTHNTALAISALQRCSNLVDLEFSSGVLGRPPPLTIPPFTLPSLQSLSMTGRSILRFLTLPSLEQLNMHGSSGVMWSFTESLLALLQRSACPLKRLSFRVPPDITTNAFRTFLLAAAPIVELKLMFGNMGTSALPLIAVFQTAELLPGLTALHISALRITDVANTTTFRHLLDMLRARRTPVAGRALLQSFSLSLGLLSARFWAAPTSAPPQGVIAEFNALADDGLRIRIANDTVLMDR